MRNLTLLLLAAAVASLGLRWWDVGRPLLISLAMAAPVMVVILGSVAAIAVGLTLPVRVPSAFAAGAAVIAGSVLVAGLAADVSPSRLLNRCRSAEAVVADTATGPDHLVVYSHNVLWRDGSPGQVAEQLVSIDPDIAVLAEAEDGFARAVADRTDGRWRIQSNGAAGTLSMAVLSRWPVSNVFEIESSERNPVLVLTVEHPSRPLTVAAVHTTAPTSSTRVLRWKRELDHLASLDVDLLVGDFNASAAHRRFRSVLAAGYRDSHAEVGCGTGLTWTPFAGPSLLHLDHVLVRAPGQAREGDDDGGPGSPYLKPVALARDGRAGSDHQAVVAVMRIGP